jgi:hypothetical protein
MRGILSSMESGSLNTTPILATFGRKTLVAPTGAMPSDKPVAYRKSEIGGNA